MCWCCIQILVERGISFSEASAKFNTDTRANEGFYLMKKVFYIFLFSLSHVSITSFTFMFLTCVWTNLVTHCLRTVHYNTESVAPSCSTIFFFLLQLRNGKHVAIMLKQSKTGSSTYIVHRPSTGIQTRLEQLNVILKTYEMVRSKRTCTCKPWFMCHM